MIEYTSFDSIIAAVGYEIPIRTDQRSLLLLMLILLIVIGVIADLKFLYVEYFNSAISLLPDLDCYVLWDESTIHAHPALLFLYQMCFQFCEFT